MKNNKINRQNAVFGVYSVQNSIINRQNAVFGVYLYDNSSKKALKRLIFERIIQYEKIPGIYVSFGKWYSKSL